MQALKAVPSVATPWKTIPVRDFSSALASTPPAWITKEADSALQYIARWHLPELSQGQVPLSLERFKDLGTGSGFVEYENAIEVSRDRGLAVCAPGLVLSVRQSYWQQKEGEIVILGTEPISIDKNDAILFKLELVDGVPQIDCVHPNADGYFSFAPETKIILKHQQPRKLQ